DALAPPGWSATARRWPSPCATGGPVSTSRTSQATAQWTAMVSAPPSVAASRAPSRAPRAGRAPASTPPRGRGPGRGVPGGAPGGEVGGAASAEAGRHEADALDADVPAHRQARGRQDLTGAVGLDREDLPAQLVRRHQVAAEAAEAHRRHRDAALHDGSAIRD